MPTNKFWFASSCYLGNRTHHYLQLSWVQKLYLIICKDQKEQVLLLAKFVKKITIAGAHSNNIPDQCSGRMVAWKKGRTTTLGKNTLNFAIWMFFLISKFYCLLCFTQYISTIIQFDRSTRSVSPFQIMNSCLRYRKRHHSLLTFLKTIVLFLCQSNCCSSSEMT